MHPTLASTRSQARALHDSLDPAVAEPDLMLVDQLLVKIPQVQIEGFSRSQTVGDSKLSIATRGSASRRRNTQALL